MKNQPPTSLSFRIRDIDPAVVVRLDELAAHAGLSRQEFIKQTIVNVVTESQPVTAQLKTGLCLVAIKNRTIVRITEILPSTTSFLRNCNLEDEAIVEKARLFCFGDQWDEAKHLLTDSGFEVFDG